MTDFDQAEFDRTLVQPLRELVAAVGEMPESRVSGPLALLELRVRYALEAYDASEGK